MEVAGLAVGLMPIFSVCIEYFQLFKTAQAASDESQVLLYRLDCEYENLIIWGERHGLFKSKAEFNATRSQELDRPETAEKVKKALGLIQNLFGNAKELKDKYSVTQSPAEAPLSAHDMDKAPYPSSTALRRLQWWKKKGGVSDQSLSLARKSMWAINDGKKFQKLIDDIHVMVESLYKILPVDEQIRNSIAIRDIRTLAGDMNKLTLFERASVDSFPAWSEVASIISEMSVTGGDGTIGRWIHGVESVTDRQPRPPGSLGGEGLIKLTLSLFHPLPAAILQ
ncbi:hypothetical protein ABW19_dt0209778 [Dactylella cylindrospora]|nr:hypothetical protein ABW19_dt0209778 [Dactylella cylindrospora]